MRPFLERLWFGFVLALFFFFRSQSEYTAYTRYFRRFILFVSFMFPVFLITAALFYFAAPGKYRPALLFAFSCLFCSWLGLRSLFFVFALSVFTFFAARLIEKNRLCAHPLRSRIWSVFSIAFCLLLMAGYKYIPYFLQVRGLTELVPDPVLGHLAVPIGLSFYLFQAIGYLADVSAGKCSSETNFIYFGLYMTYFPKFVSGPIESFQDFVPQLSKLRKLKFLDRGRLSLAFTYLLYGYFMKLVIADRLSPLVGVIFEAPENFDSLWLAIGAFLYTIQIYCDFAGYSFIALGCSRLFGISLTPNFVTPYFAENITQFWRRWHVSLSCWLRDYVYIPLGGNRKGFWRKCVNTLIVFLLCGMWHGAGLSFVAWGLLHGLFCVADSLLKKRGKKLPFSRLTTFLEVAFAWIFFRASGLGSALKYIFLLFTCGIRPGQTQEILKTLNLDLIEILVILIGILLVFLMDYHGYKNHMLFPELVQEKDNSVRYMIFYVLIILLFIFGIYGPGYHTEQFIYMQF